MTVEKISSQPKHTEHLDPKKEAEKTLIDMELGNVRDEKYRELVAEYEKIFKTAWTPRVSEQ